MVKNPPTDSGDTGDAGSILGQEDPLEKGMATCSSILRGNSMDRGAWQAIVRGISKVGHN